LFEFVKVKGVDEKGLKESFPVEVLGTFRPVKPENAPDFCKR